MAIRKNTRRFDPRYFMDEKTDVIKKEKSKVLEEAFANAADESGIVNSTALATNTDPSIVNHAIDIYNAIMKGTV